MRVRHLPPASWPSRCARCSGIRSTETQPGGTEGRWPPCPRGPRRVTPVHAQCLIPDPPGSAEFAKKLTFKLQTVCLHSTGMTEAHPFLPPTRCLEHQQCDTHRRLLSPCTPEFRKRQNLRILKSLPKKTVTSKVERIVDVTSTRRCFYFALLFKIILPQCRF